VYAVRAVEKKIIIGKEKKLRKYCSSNYRCTEGILAQFIIINYMK